RHPPPTRQPRASDGPQTTGKPSTSPPTLPIPTSGVTGLDAKQTAQDSAIAAINWSSLPGKPSTFPPTLPINESDVTNLVSDLAGKASTASVALKADIASPTFTGDPKAP